MAGASRADLFVGRVRRVAAGVPDRGRPDPVGLPEDLLGAPEAAQAEHHRLEAGGERRLDGAAGHEMRLRDRELVVIASLQGLVRGGQFGLRPEQHVSSVRALRLISGTCDPAFARRNLLPMTQWGLDTLFNPAKRHMDEEKRRLQSTREEVGDASGGKRIDLESGKVTIQRGAKDEDSADEIVATTDAAAEDTDPSPDDAEDASAEARPETAADRARARRARQRARRLRRLHRRTDFTRPRRRRHRSAATTRDVTRPRWAGVPSGPRTGARRPDMRGVHRAAEAMTGSSEPTSGGSAGPVGAGVFRIDPAEPLSRVNSVLAR